MDRSRYTMTSCNRGGVRIHKDHTSTSHTESVWEKEVQEPTSTKPKETITNAQGVPTLASLEDLELDINAYSFKDVLRLFQLNDKDTLLTDDAMRHAKKIVTRIHPDKSRLPDKYFAFFNAAYQMLEYGYDIQHRGKQVEKQRTQLMTDLADMPRTYVPPTSSYSSHKSDASSSSGDFNSWFNEEFERKGLVEVGSCTSFSHTDSVWEVDVWSL